mmetsp:Transcript_21437/g.46569  ORF Transcript_21437/g.46569 Transcript_21437/m.46569 type:complete len:224 (-) Transcript_21437:2804-3475(-)
MCSTKLRLSDGNSVTSLQLTSNATTMRSTIESPTTSNLLTSMLLTLFSSSVLDAKFRRRLGRLVASRDLTSLPPTVSGAEGGPSYGRLVTAFLFAAFSTSMGCTEILVTGTLIASWKCASPAASVSNTKPGCALCAFDTPFSLALTATRMPHAVRAFGNGNITASFNAAWLLVNGKQARINRLHIYRMCRGRAIHVLLRYCQYHRPFCLGDWYYSDAMVCTID